MNDVESWPRNHQGLSVSILNKRQVYCAGLHRHSQCTIVNVIVKEVHRMKVCIHV